MDLASGYRWQTRVDTDRIDRIADNRCAVSDTVVINGCRQHPAHALNDGRTASVVDKRSGVGKMMVKRLPGSDRKLETPL